VAKRVNGRFIRVCGDPDMHVSRAAPDSPAPATDRRRSGVQETYSRKVGEEETLGFVQKPIRAPILLPSCNVLLIS
jgi:hypothetical protein